MFDHVTRLTDTQLLEHADRLAATARMATAELVAHLVEIETRRLHLGLGFESLYAYCRQRLRLSEYGAYHRIEACRVATRFPRVLTMLAAGELTLATIRVLGPHLTGENAGPLLDEASGRTKAEVEDIAVRLRPRPDVPTVVRPVCVLRAPSAVAVPDRLVTPLAPDRYRVQVTMSGSAVEKLRQATDLLRHALPSGDAAAVLEKALDALLVDLLRRKAALVTSPRATESDADSRHVGAAVRREVYVRDEGRCAYVAADGRRCGSRAFTEYHHRANWSSGGPTTPQNLELRCAAHNRFAALDRSRLELAPGPVPGA